LDRRLGGPQNQSGHGGEEENSKFMSNSESDKYVVLIGSCFEKSEFFLLGASFRYGMTLISLYF